MVRQGIRAFDQEIGFLKLIATHSIRYSEIYMEMRPEGGLRRWVRLQGHRAREKQTVAFIASAFSNIPTYRVVNVVGATLSRVNILSEYEVS